MVRITLCIVLLGLGVSRAEPPVPKGAEGNLLTARKGHRTQLTEMIADGKVQPLPPSHMATRVNYRGPAGSLHADVSLPPGPGRHPAMVWLVGGFPIGGTPEGAWDPPAQVENEQTARAYRHGGFIMMYPTLRGTFGNEGHQEYFYGEVNDVLAAIRVLRARRDVDPNRIFVGGHSTGATLALLVAAATSDVAGVVALGPVDDSRRYRDSVLFDPSNEREAAFRAPVAHLAAITQPTFVVEGAGGNLFSLSVMRDANRNPRVHFEVLAGHDHFGFLSLAHRYFAGELARKPVQEVSLRPLRAEAGRSVMLEELSVDRARVTELEAAYGKRRMDVHVFLGYDGESARLTEAAKARGVGVTPRPRIELRKGQVFELRLEDLPAGEALLAQLAWVREVALGNGHVFGWIHVLR